MSESKINSGAGIDESLLEPAPAPAPSIDSDEVKKLKAQIANLMQVNKMLANAAIADESNMSEASGKERFGIIIDEGLEQQALTEVPVGVNGRVYQIVRGMYVEVPKEVISVLNDAVEAKAVSSFDANGMPAGITMRNMRRFPFQNYGMAIDADGNRVQEPVKDIRAV